MRRLFGNSADDLLVVIDNRAGDDPGVRAQQIGDQRRDLVRLDQLPHRQPGLGLIEPVVGRVVEGLLHHMLAGCIHPAGRNAIAADQVGPVGVGRVHGQRRQPAFRCRIGRQEALPDMRRGRQNVDHGARLASFQQMAHNALHHEERATDVGRHMPVEQFRRGVGQAVRDVSAAELTSALTWS